MALLGALGGAPGAAAQSHVFAGSIGSAGVGAGQLELSVESGLAVEQSNGDVYVADSGNHRVDEFDPSKPPSEQFVRAIGWGVATGAPEPQTCTSSCLAGLSGAGPGQFERPTFIAVDNAPGGSGDVYIADLGAQASERQSVSLSATGGSYTLSFTSTLRATLTAGSDVLTDVIGRHKFGDPISGPGIPAGATIVEEAESGRTVTLSVNATSGGRAVLGATETTGTIPSNATPAELQAALENLPALEASVCVSGGAGGPYTVEFCRVLANTNVPQMTCDGSALTPAGSSCTVATAVDGLDTARVETLDPSGQLVASWGGTPAAGELDGTECLGSECPNNPRFRRLEGIVVNTAGNLLVLSGPFEDEANSGTPSITEWSGSSGEYARSIGTFGNGAPIGLAVDPSGRLYMGRAGVGAFEVIQALLEGSAYVEQFLVDRGPATAVAVDPSNEDAYVARFNPSSDHSDVASYDSLGHLLESSIGGNGEIARSAGIAVYGSNENVYVADSGAGHIEVFALGGAREMLTVRRAGSGLGTVSSQPAGIACPSLCSAQFAEGQQVTLTASAPAHASFIGWAGACSGAETCHLTLTGVTQATAEFAQNRPTLTTAPASQITRHTATLAGTIDPEGDASSCVFQYGTTTAYGSEAPCASHPGSGTSAVAVSAQLWELAASTTYHYRLVAANAGGTSAGPDRTFTTAPETCATDVVLCPPAPVCPNPLAFCFPPPSCATSAALCVPPRPVCARGHARKVQHGKAVCVKTRKLKCRSGHRKRRVKGKPRCVKARPAPGRGHRSKRRRSHG